MKTILILNITNKKTKELFSLEKTFNEFIPLNEHCNIETGLYMTKIKSYYFDAIENKYSIHLENITEDADKITERLEFLKMRGWEL